MTRVVLIPLEFRLFQHKIIDRRHRCVYFASLNRSCNQYTTDQRRILYNVNSQWCDRSLSLSITLPLDMLDDRSFSPAFDWTPFSSHQPYGRRWKSSPPFWAHKYDYMFQRLGKCVLRLRKIARISVITFLQGWPVLQSLEWNSTLTLQMQPITQKVSEKSKNNRCCGQQTGMHLLSRLRSHACDLEVRR